MVNDIYHSLHRIIRIKPGFRPSIISDIYSNVNIYLLHNYILKGENDKFEIEENRLLFFRTQQIHRLHMINVTRAPRRNDVRDH